MDFKIIIECSFFNVLDIQYPTAKEYSTFYSFLWNVGFYFIKSTNVFTKVKSDVNIITENTNDKIDQID